MHSTGRVVLMLKVLDRDAVIGSLLRDLFVPEIQNCALSGIRVDAVDEGGQDALVEGLTYRQLWSPQVASEVLGLRLGPLEGVVGGLGTVG